MDFDEFVLIYDSLEDREEIEGLAFSNIYVNYLDIRGKFTKKQARCELEDWGAKKLPFIILKKENKVIYCIYRESDNNPINTLKTLLTCQKN